MFFVFIAVFIAFRSFIVLEFLPHSLQVFSNVTLFLTNTCQLILFRLLAPTLALFAEVCEHLRINLRHFLRYIFKQEGGAFGTKFFLSDLEFYFTNQFVQISLEGVQILEFVLLF